MHISYVYARKGFKTHENTRSVRSVRPFKTRVARSPISRRHAETILDSRDFVPTYRWKSHATSVQKSKGFIPICAHLLNSFEN